MSLIMQCIIRYFRSKKYQSVYCYLMLHRITRFSVTIISTLLSYGSARELMKDLELVCQGNGLMTGMRLQIPVIISAAFSKADARFP